MESFQFPPDTIFEGNYLLKEELGSGATGIVYKAWQDGLGRNVAIKILKGEFQSDPELRARFEREGKALSRLDHRNVVSFYSYGFINNTTPYLVLEYAEGTTLTTFIREGVLLDPSMFFSVINQLCDGLQHAHSHGVIHRDLKPSNILICSDGTVKIMDFGLTKLTADQSQKLTQPGAVLGTVLFMSPESCQGKNADERSDIYSLGCILYNCLTKRPPFHAEDARSTMFQHIHADPPDLWEAQSETATRYPQLQDVILRCLQKNPEQRYATVSDLKAALNAATASDNSPSNKARLRANGESRREVIAAIVATAVISGVAFLTINHHLNTKLSRETSIAKDPDTLSPAQLKPAKNDPYVGVPANLRHKYETLCLRAKELFNDGYWPQAAEAMNEAVKLAPECACGFQQRGWYRTLCGDKSAVSDLNEAIRLAPNDWVTYYYRAMYFHKYSQPQRKLEDVEAAIKLNPGAAFLYQLRAEAYDKLGNTVEAARSREMQWKIVRRQTH